MRGNDAARGHAREGVGSLDLVGEGSPHGPLAGKIPLGNTMNADHSIGQQVETREAHVNPTRARLGGRGDRRELKLDDHVLIEDRPRRI